jgi:hypothetical protein
MIAVLAILRSRPTTHQLANMLEQTPEDMQNMLYHCKSLVIEHGSTLYLIRLS